VLTLVGVAAEAVAEVVTVRKTLKGSVSLAELAAKLEQCDAMHDADTNDLRIQARKVAGLEAEVSRLAGEAARAKEEAKLEKEKAREAAVVVLEEAKKMDAEFQEQLRGLKEKHKVEIEGHEKSHRDIAGEHSKVVEGYDRKLLELGARERRVEEEVRWLNTHLACEFPLPG
jgi:hypothetical protein